MCTGLEIAALAATVGGTIMQNQQQRASMKNYNNQVSAQNKTLQDQFQDRQNKIKAAQDGQARTFKEMSAAQDAEFTKQTELAKQKQAALQTDVQKPALTANGADFQAAVENRNKLFADTSTNVTGDYGSSTQGGTEDRVLRDIADKVNTSKKAETAGIAGAQAKLGAQQDAQLGMGQLFRGIDTDLGDIAKDSQASSNLLSARLRLPEYHMGALGAVQGEAANSPYFQGQQPVYRTPNTLFSDLLTGAGQIGSTLAFHQPAGSASGLSQSAISLAQGGSIY